MNYIIVGKLELIMVIHKRKGINWSCWTELENGIIVSFKSELMKVVGWIIKLNKIGNI